MSVLGAVWSGGSDGHPTSPRMEQCVVAPRSSASLRPDVEETLRSGQRAMRRIRYRVSAVMMGLGMCFFAVGGLGYVWLWDQVWDDGLAWVLQSMGLILINLAAVREEPSFTRMVVFLNIFCLGINLFWDAQLGSFHYFFSGAYQVIYSSYLAACAIAAMCLSAEEYQQVMWHLLLAFFSAQLLVDTFEIFDPWLDYANTPMGRRGSPAPFSAFVVGDLIGVVCSSLSCFRHAVHRRLSRAFSRKGAEAAAASIAALIGDCPVNEVVAQAARRFRCVLLSELSRSDLASSAPQPGLHDRTRRIKLGDCDAFVSHSWSDDEGAKWEALQGWCERFRAERGREPTLWLDKCCIDQTDIEVNLRCLPVFISGCKQLVVLCGPTYFSRLWCVLEIFTHYHMGCGTHRLSVVRVLREGFGEADAQEVQWEADNFDVSQCNSSSPSDMQKIMDVILAAFGSTDTFNLTIRRVLRDAGIMDVSSDSESVTSEEE